MTDSENSQPQDDSDEDIYKDIPEFNFEDELAKLEGSKEIYKQEASDLSEKVKALTEENKELKKLNEVLKKNLSTLLKTAQAEVQRKDSMIEELRSKVESFTFRRNKKPTSDKLSSTDDLNGLSEVKHETEKRKSDSEKQRSKSYENWTSSDSERRFNLEEEKKIGLQPGKEENSNCDDKKSGENSQNANFRHSGSSRNSRNEKRKEKKSTKYEDSSGHRRPLRENHRDHLLYDSFADKKRHSRSSDNRFLSRRRSSRERRRDRRRSGSCERRRSHRRDESSERSRRRDSRKERSRSRGSKDSSLEKPKSRFSLEKDLASRAKEGVGAKPEVLKGGIEGVENKKRVENCEKKRSGEEIVVVNGKNKQNKEKGSGKSEKRKNSEMFSTKSPLDALYNDMVASRSFNQFSNSKRSKGTQSESDLEEGEVFVTGNEYQETNQVEEDWALSFKNERQNETKPMTLYSRRMMQKFSLESKEKQVKKNKDEEGGKKKSEQSGERKSSEKLIETEKEPGELTDDENVIESSKEFQELTKVAAIESEIIKTPGTEPCKESVTGVDMRKMEALPKDCQRELEEVINSQEEPATCKDIDSSKETCDVIEFSPFKNNYKLIEISPVKATGSEHILDFYNKKVPPTNLAERANTLDSRGEKAGGEEVSVGKMPHTSDEKDSCKNSSSESILGTELKIATPSLRSSSKESEKATEANTTKEKEPQKDEKEAVKKKEKKSKTCKEETQSGRRKRSSLRKETEKSFNEERTRKRKLNDETEAKPDPKKQKLEKSEPPRKSTRSKRNWKNDTESQRTQEKETEPVQERENKMKEDISSFEFFKPITRAEPPDTPVDIAISVCPATDYKMTATMSLTGVVRLETPNKCMSKLKNLMINEQMIFNILDSKNNSQFSPLIGTKSIEMTPRRMLKNDLMLTDSEDDSINKRNAAGEDNDEAEERVEEEEEEEEEEGNLSGSEYSDCGSDSGASDFVDLL